MSHKRNLNVRKRFFGAGVGAAGGGGGVETAGLVDAVVVGGLVWILLTVACAAGTASFAGKGVVDEGVAGEGAGLPGPPGPRGTPADGLSALKPGSELRIVSLRSA